VDSPVPLGTTGAVGGAPGFVDATAWWCAPLAAAWSSILGMLAPSLEVGQTLNETSPTSVMNTIAAPARRAPDAPTPTIRLSGVLFAFVLAAA
jgi:hypothetical protein